MVKAMNKNSTMQLRRIELKRAFQSRGMLLSLTIGCILSLIHVIQYQILPLYLNDGMTIPEIAEFSKRRTVAPSAIAGSWLAGNPTNWAGFVFFLILPILAMLPFGGVLFFGPRKWIFKKSLYKNAPEAILNKQIFSRLFIRWNCCNCSFGFKSALFHDIFTEPAASDNTSIQFY